MVAAGIACSESSWHILWVTAFGLGTLAMAVLVGVGAHAAIKEVRKSGFEFFRYAPLRWLAIAIPVAVIFLVGPSTYHHFDDQFFGYVVNCGESNPEPEPFR